MQSQRSLLELLKSVRKRIERPERWTQSAFARDSDGKVVSYSDDNRACAWCLEGAIEAEISSNFPLVNTHDVFSTFKNCVPDYFDRYSNNALFEFNDANTHSDVLALLDKSISNVSNELSMA